MPRLCMEDLEEIREKHKEVFTLRADGYRAKVIIHMGPCGIAAGARSVMTAMMDEISKARRTDIILTKSSCGGLCAREPLATVETINLPPVRYCNLNDKKTREIFREHVIGGKPLKKYALAAGCERTC
jgi:NADP-reducing hydrogenase subunit HndB